MKTKSKRTPLTEEEVILATEVVDRLQNTQMNIATTNRALKQFCGYRIKNMSDIKETLSTMKSVLKNGWSN